MISLLFTRPFQDPFAFLQVWVYSWEGGFHSLFVYLLVGRQRTINSMTYSNKPTGITADRQPREMTIQWRDGHTSVYSFTLLRKACPCAECRGGHENMSSGPTPEVFTYPREDSPATRMKNVESVGTYALTIEWDDGHHYGIYNWNYLRKLCPCPTCRSANSNDGE